jgi:hypothetical protein
MSRFTVSGPEAGRFVVRDNECPDSPTEEIHLPIIFWDNPRLYDFTLALPVGLPRDSLTQIHEICIDKAADHLSTSSPSATA